MPAQNPSQLHALVQSQIPDNNNNLIDPAEVRAVLDAIIDSVYNLVTSPAPNAPTLEAVLAEGNESGASDVIVSTGRYLIFRDPAGNKVRVRPVQSPIGSIAYRDITLPLRSGTIALLDDLGGASWLEPVSGQVDQPTGSEVDGTRYLVGTGATGLFAGHPGDVAELVDGTWTFSPTNNGDMVRCLADTAGVIRTKTGGLWVMPPDISDALSLDAVLGVGNTTDGHDIEVSELDAVAFRNNGHLMRLVGQDIAEDHTVIMPDDDGTLATVEAVNTLLATLNLQAVLVNGNETNGRSIQVSEFDGVNFLQGANYVRLKAPAVAAAARTLLLPDKSGTVATTDDVNAVAAMVDGAMRAPEAYTPTGGLYPTTFGGNAIERGDTYRCAAGTMGARTVDAEDLLIALVDAPGQTDANWQVIESNRVVATQAEAEDNTSTDTAKLMPPQRWWQAWTKGLTLSAFGSAVRGMILMGYTVGANVAVAATDSIMGAVAKLQGQLNAANTNINGKLAKASNLSDVANASMSRINLGLKAYATEDYADAVVRRAMLDLDLSPEPGVGSIVIMGTDGKYHCATPDNALSQRVGIVAEYNGSQVRVQFSGILDMSAHFPPLAPGIDYYLDPDTPGGITSVRPAAHAIYVGTCCDAARNLDFRPSRMEQAGTATMAADATTSDAAGLVSNLATLELAGGATYEITVHATTNAATGAGRVRLWLDVAGTAAGKGEISISKSSSNDIVMVQINTADAFSPNANSDTVTEEDDLQQHLNAIVYIDEHSPSPVSVVFGPLNDTKNVVLRAGARITWKRIG